MPTQDPEPSDESLAESMLLVFGQLGNIESEVTGVSKEIKGVAKRIKGVEKAVNGLTNVIIFLFIAVPAIFYFGSQIIYG